MKILYFTFIVPSKYFGGGIGVMQSIKSLCQFAEVDYVGPKFNAMELKDYGINLHNITIINNKIGKVKRISNFIFKGVTSGFYEEWKRAVEDIDISKYDCIYLEFSRQDFVAKWAKEKEIPLAIRVHNVESDYFKALYREKKNLQNFIHAKISKYSEKYCVDKADKVIALTKHDKKRLVQIYGIEKEKIKIIPVCVPNEITNLSIGRDKPYILLAGSLWFGPNAEGTEWFLREVWSQLDNTIGNDYDLLIVGSNPNQSIKTLALKYKNIDIYENPKDIKPFYQGAALFIAPIFYGAGMKVKVAEALACSLPVVGTPHALIGYEAMKNYIFPSKNADTFTQNIEGLLKKSDGEKVKIKENIKIIFEKNYSLNSCKEKMEEIIREVVNRS